MSRLRVLMSVAVLGWLSFLLCPLHAGVVVVSPPAATGSGLCTIVEAVAVANTGQTGPDTGGCALLGGNGGGGDGFPSGNVVLLQPGTYQVTQADNDWYGPNAFPAISGDVVIVGSSYGSVIQAQPSSGPLRLFYVGGGESLANYDPPPGLTNLPGPGTLELVNVTVEGGLAEGGISKTGGGGLGAGGAIYDQGTVILSGVTLEGNVAEGGSSENVSSATLGYGGGGIGGGSDANGDGGGFSPDNGGLWAPPGTAVQTAYGQFGNGGQANSNGVGQNGGVGGGGGHGLFGNGSGGYGGGGGANSSGGFGAGGGESGGFGGGNGSNAYGAYGGGGAGLGGAVFVEGGTLEVTDSTLTENSAAGGSTSSSGNGGDGLGGAIFDLNGTVSITFSTIAGNTVQPGVASGGTGASNGQALGDGLFELYLAKPGSPAADASTAARVTVDSSILWGNIDNATNSTPNCEVAGLAGFSGGSGATFEGSDVVVGDPGESVTVSGLPAVACTSYGPDDVQPRTESDPDLSPLASNGGPTETMAISPTGPAAAFSTLTEPAVDQRGYLRGSTPDAGAYQASGSPAPVAVTIAPPANVVVPAGETASGTLVVTGAGPLVVTAESGPDVGGVLAPGTDLLVNCPNPQPLGAVGTETCAVAFPAVGASGLAGVEVAGSSYGKIAVANLLYGVTPRVVGLTDETVTVGGTVPAESFELVGTGPFTVSVRTTNGALLPEPFVGLSSGCGTVSEECTLTLEPTAGETGTASVEVKAEDALGQGAVDAMTLTVEPQMPPSSSGGGTGSVGLLALGVLVLGATGRRWRRAVKA